MEVVGSSPWQGTDLDESQAAKRLAARVPGRGSIGRAQGSIELFLQYGFKRRPARLELVARSRVWKCQKITYETDTIGVFGSVKEAAWKLSNQ